MTDQRLIDVPEGVGFLAIRDEYLSITGDACAAALLDFFERFSAWKRTQGREDWEWVYVEQAALVEALRGMWSLGTIKTRLMWLRDGDAGKGKRIGGVGFLEARRHSANPWDKELEYRLDTAWVNQAMQECGLTFRVVEITPTEGQEQPSEKSDLTFREGKNDLSEGENRLFEGLEPTVREVKIDPDLLESFLAFLLRYLQEIASQESPTQPPRAGAHDGDAVPPVVVVDPDDQSHWDSAFHQMQIQLDKFAPETLRGAFLKRVERADDTTTFVVGVRDSYSLAMLQRRLYRTVRRILSDVSGAPKELRFEIDIAPKPVEDADRGEIPLWRKLARDAEATDFGYETVTVRGVFEREFGAITDEREAAVERLETYGVKAFGEALEILKNRKARGAVSDPLGFVLGVLSNRKANVRT